MWTMKTGRWLSIENFYSSDKIEKDALASIDYNDLLCRDMVL